MYAFSLHKARGHAPEAGAWRCLARSRVGSVPSAVRSSRSKSPRHPSNRPSHTPLCVDRPEGKWRAFDFNDDSVVAPAGDTSEQAVVVARICRLDVVQRRRPAAIGARRMRDQRMRLRRLHGLCSFVGASSPSATSACRSSLSPTTGSIPESLSLDELFRCDLIQCGQRSPEADKLPKLHGVNALSRRPCWSQTVTVST